MPCVRRIQRPSAIPVIPAVTVWKPSASAGSAGPGPRRIRAACITLLLVFFAGTRPAAGALLPVAADSVDAPRIDFLPFYWFRVGWETRPGDLSAPAEILLDTPGWAPVRLTGYRDRYVRPRTDPQSGIGWARITVVLDSALASADLALIVAGGGAFEVYLDARLVHAVGRVSDTAEHETYGLVVDTVPDAVALPALDPGPHTLAVRYSGHAPGRYPHLQYHRGVAMGLQRLGNVSELRQISVRDRSNHQTFLVAAALAFALIHGLIFAFYPRIRSNLYYALLTVAVAGAGFLPIQIYGFADSLASLYVLDIAWKAALLMAAVASIRFLTVAFDESIGIFAWIIQVAAALGLLCAPFLSLTPYYVLLLVSYVEVLRLVFVGLSKRRPGAWIVGLGFSLLILGTAHAVLLELNVIALVIPYSYLFASLGLLIAMAAYLARNFSESSRDLSEQIAEVQTLNARRLEQERNLVEREARAQEEENRRRLLEADNALKLRELEEARKRQAILEALERSTQELERTQGQLLRSEKLAALGNLVAGIAHEINTPVGAINSMHDTLVRAMDGLRADIAGGRAIAEDARIETALEAMEGANRVIASGTERVTRIARSLRTFARLDEAEMMEADIHAGLDATLPLIDHYVKAGIEVVRDYGELPAIVCFPSRLNQVFLNLLLNAAQAISGRGTITIRTRRRGDRAVVEITDTGRGIAAEHLDQVFDPGFTTRGVGVGTGLGLSICYQIVGDHQGDIYLTSTEGEGTTVTVTLPLTPRAQEDATGGRP